MFNENKRKSYENIPEIRRVLKMQEGYGKKKENGECVREDETGFPFYGRTKALMASEWRELGRV